jgi:FkbM family methyltransferase
MRAGAYLPTALHEQGREQEVLDRQRREVERYVAERGWELVAVYEDATSRTARPSERPGLARLMQELDGLDRVVVTRLERLRPSARACFQVVRQLQDSGVELASIGDGFDTGEDSGRAVMEVLRQAADWQTNAETAGGWSPENLRKPGFDPATVIDAGAGAGTPALHQAFPKAHLVMIEPLREWQADLERQVAQHGGEYVLKAVGARSGTASFNVDHDSLVMSSLLERGSKPAAGSPGVDQREVPVTTLDELWRERGWKPPFGLKLDTEGYEDQVIEGAQEVLRQTQFVIAEVSVVPERFDGSYTFAQFIALMDRHGFRLCDVLDAPRKRRAQELKYMDVLFRPA